jgi:hypothetical protein
MDKESERFAYVRQKFPKKSDAKIKEGIFVGPRIKQLFENHDISTKLNATERRARKAFENVWRTFLGNEKADNYSDIVQELISSYSACNMSLKLHFMHSHLNFFFSENMGAISDKHGKTFIRTFPKWTMKNGVQVYWLATAGVL